MGIPKFKKNITKMFKCEKQIKNIKITDNYNILVDFNSFIHIAQNKYLETVYKTLKVNILTNQKIDQYIDNINKNILDGITDETIKLYNEYIANIKSNIGINSTITIFIDGIPPFAKVVEQINRTFMDKINKLYEETVINELDLNENVLTNYINAKKKIAEVLISPGEDIIKKIIVKLKNTGITINGDDKYGEGEAKLIKHIKDNKLTNCVAVSADADVIILLSILYVNHLPNSQFYLLDGIDNKNSIDITLLCANIKAKIVSTLNSFIKKIVFGENDEIISLKLIINELCFIFTIFGNDFIPGSPFITPDNLNVLIYTYCEFLIDKEQHNILPILQFTDEKAKCNIESYKHFLHYIKKYEDFKQTFYMLDEKYLFVPIDDAYLKHMYDVTPTVSPRFVQQTNENIKALNDIYANKSAIYIVNYIKNLDKLDVTNANYNDVKNIIYYIFSNNIGDNYNKINEFYGIVNDPNNKPSVDNLKDTVYSELHQTVRYKNTNINKALIDLIMNTDIQYSSKTEYPDLPQGNDFQIATDKKIGDEYKDLITNNYDSFNKSLGKYRALTTDHKEYIGKMMSNYCYLDIEEEEEEEEEEKILQNWYINDEYVDNYNKLFSNIDEACDQYTSMLFWIVNHYYNYNYIETNSSISVYKYAIPPLMLTLSTYLENLDVDILQSNVLNNTVEINKYFNMDQYKVYRSFGGLFERRMNSEQQNILEETKHLFTNSSINFDTYMGNKDVFIYDINCMHAQYITKCVPNVILRNMPKPLTFINTIKSAKERELLTKILNDINQIQNRKNNIKYLINLLK